MQWVSAFFPQLSFSLFNYCKLSKLCINLIIGLKTKILELDWAQFAKQDAPGEAKEKLALPSAFETHARFLRFRALGTACRERGITALLMGHHQDDTVETTIWRLSSGGRGTGLAGIAEIARIPECHGLFGVSESGSSVQLSKHGRHGQMPMHVQVDDKNKGSIFFNSKSTQKSPEHNAPSIPTPATANRPVLPGVSISTGGIHICRPLLSFPKASLLETCHQNKIPYVSDPTNFDPTLTPRNAIRSMLASDSLPRALRAPSILSLIRSSQAFLHSSTHFSNQLLSSRCRILDLNLKAGTMVLQILDIPSFLDPLRSQLDSSRRFQIQSLTLRRITEIVSPFHGNYFPVRSYEPFVAGIFSRQGPNIGAGSESKTESALIRRNFTLGGVMIQPLTVKDTHGQIPGGNNIWLLSRQPFFKNKAPVARFDITLSDTPMRWPYSDSRSLTGFAPWTLWDDRYWFRFQVTSAEKDKDQKNRPAKTRALTLVIRPFERSDFSKINLDPSLVPEMKPKKKKFAIILRNLVRSRVSEEAPGSARFTLPVLAVEGPSETSKPANHETEQLIALPTLDFPLDPLAKKRATNTWEFTYAEEKWKVKWEWMYKRVDVEAIRLMGGPVEVEAESASVHNKKV